MRVLGLDEQHLDIALDKTDEQGVRTVIVEVPGFGYVMVGCPDGRWVAAVVVPPSLAPRELGAANIVDGRIEVPMLHKADRLDVVIEGLVDA